MSVNATRRDVLKLAGAATAGLAACSGIALAEESAAVAAAELPGGILPAELEATPVVIDTITDFAEEKDYDVVVVGAGTTGMPAALAAAEAGAKVAVLQKEEVALAQGMLCARVVKEESTEVGIAEYVHEMHTIYDHRPSIALQKEYADRSGEAVDWYVGKLDQIGYTDFSESDSKNHEYDDGNCQVRGWLFTGGMINPTQALAEHAAEFGFDVYYSMPGVQLVTDGGAVVGVVGQDKDGNFVKFNAAKGVILATGDYQNNTALVEHYCVDAQQFGRAQSFKTGDGHLMGMAVGAVMEPGCHCKMIHGSAGCFREEPFLAVNVNGERFMYEDVAYGARNTILRDQPERRMYSIFDANYTDQVYGWGSDPTVKTVANGTPEQIAKFVENGVLLSADTLEELAEAAGLPVDAFTATVARYNELCEQGADVDFGKASKYMQPVAEPPFYAMPREYRIAAIPAGLVIDVNGQCKDAEGNLIPGLFAAGNCSGPFYSDIDYSLSTMGLSVGRCVTFGYITGSYVASL